MTIRSMLQATVDAHGSRVALRFKRDGAWHPITYSELLARIRCVSEMLSHGDVHPGDRVGMFMENTPEWPEIYLGIVSIGAIAVPIDAKLHEREVAHILADSRCVSVFCSARCGAVLREVADDQESLHLVILVGDRHLTSESTRRTRYLNYEDGAAHVRETAGKHRAAFDRHAPHADDIASILYTSGTTGRSKGAMLTHDHFCANARQCAGAFSVSPNDRFLLVLPLHHAFAFTTNLVLPLSVGAEISFVESLKTIGENMREVAPSIVIGVPLLLEKMYARLMKDLRRHRVAAWMLRLGLGRPVRRRLFQTLGGRLRFFIVGGAASSPAILAGFERLGIPILEGYGLTETAPVLTINPPGHPRIGSVGRPLPEVDIAIHEPNAIGIGEIKARGPNVMTGYYRNPEATAEVMQDGWFMTGDLGRVDADGYVWITGRKKNLIVNGAGKNIYPEEIEVHILESCPTVLEVLVLGFRTPGETGERVGAIVVPDHAAVEARVGRYRVPLPDAEERKLVLEDIRRACREIAEFKRPQRIHFRQEEFEKTSTGKIKRYLYAVDPSEA